ncbi:diguanylate cyclase [Pseudomonas syringae]|uniref:Diguanylate cyclase n=1 Tax=Pseudomonas syringae TaxID=317 RepID=A0A1C7Z749_PSESX|nr:diguanylate cyclase [Pseudomonas syringae]OCR25771.1 diguanylate cyclase [Pseudomonas syringae]
MRIKYYLAGNRPRLFNSVVTRLLLLALCIIIFGAVLRYYVLSNFLREDLAATVQRQQLALASYVAQDVDSKIVQRQRLLERLAADMSQVSLAEPAQLQVWLNERFEYQTLFSDIAIFNAQGGLLTSAPVLDGQRDPDYAGRDYLQAALAGRPFVGSPQPGISGHGPLIPIAVPVKKPTGEIAAVLVGNTALAAPGFLDSLFHNRMGETGSGFALVFPRDKQLVESAQLPMTLKPVAEPGVDTLNDGAMAEFRGAGVTVNAKGSEEVAAMASVASTGWFVVARVPGSEAFATVNRLQHFLLKGVFFTVLVFGTLSALGIYLVFRQLFTAAAQADRMTRGEQPLAPLPVIHDDEIGHLISAFNRLLLKLNAKQAELERMAHHDALTNLPNRAYLSRRLRESLALAQRKQTHVGLLFMDLDGFKGINDSLGHDAGDEVLRQVAMRFASVVRETDTLARIGGDEFVVLLGDLGHDAETAVSAVAVKCIDALNAPFYLAGTVCVVGVSIGISWGDGNSSESSLLLAADRVMYQAKKTGRGRFLSSRV